MRGVAGSGPSLDLSAVGSGVLWGLVLLLTAALGFGVYDYRLTLSPETEMIRTLTLQALAAGLAGLRAGWLADRSGLLHGAVAGLGLVGVAAVVMGVLTELPTMAGLLKGLLAGGATGALAGVGAVNLSGK